MLKFRKLHPPKQLHFEPYNWPGCNIFQRLPPVSYGNLPPCHRDPKALGFSSSPGAHGSHEIRWIRNDPNDPSSKNDATGRPYGSFDNGLFFIFQGTFFLKQNTGPSKQGPSFCLPVHTIELRVEIVEHSSTTQQIQGWFQGPQYWDPLITSFPYYFHTIPISLGILMGVVWE